MQKFSGVEKQTAVDIATETQQPASISPDTTQHPTPAPSGTGAVST